TSHSPCGFTRRGQNRTTRFVVSDSQAEAVSAQRRGRVIHAVFHNMSHAETSAGRHGVKYPTQKLNKWTGKREGATRKGSAIQTLWLMHSDDEARDRQYEATIAALIGIGPKDELEGMMAAQLIAAHNAAMECYRRAMIGEQTLERRRENLGQANKLSRTYAVLLDALNRHRGKGQQKVTVEHVHVHPGGQAVVETVERPTPANSSRSENQSDARQITHAPQPAMRSPNAEREGVPVASDAKRPMSDARWTVPRSTEGK